MSEEASRVADPERFGYCGRCGGPMSAYDWLHSQGHHHAECFQITIEEIRIQESWKRLKAMGMHVLDDLEDELRAPNYKAKRGFKVEVFKDEGGEWKKEG